MRSNCNILPVGLSMAQLLNLRMTKFTWETWEISRCCLSMFQYCWYFSLFSGLISTPEGNEIAHSSVSNYWLSAARTCVFLIFLIGTIPFVRQHVWSLEQEHRAPHIHTIKRGQEMMQHKRPWQIMKDQHHSTSIAKMQPCRKCDA